MRQLDLDMETSLKVKYKNPYEEIKRRFYDRLRLTGVKKQKSWILA